MEIGKRPETGNPVEKAQDKIKWAVNAYYGKRWIGNSPELRDAAYQAKLVCAQKVADALQEAGREHAGPLLEKLRRLIIDCYDRNPFNRTPHLAGDNSFQDLLPLLVCALVTEKSEGNSVDQVMTNTRKQLGGS